MRRSILPLGWALCAVILVSGCGGSDAPKSDKDGQPNNEAVPKPDEPKPEEQAQSPPDQSLLKLIGQSVTVDLSTPEATFQSHLRANIAQDWQATLEVLPPATRDDMIRLATFRALVAAAESVPDVPDAPERR